MSRGTYIKQSTLTQELENWRVKINELAQSLGLDYYPVEYELVDWDTMAMVAAYSGFPRRYPHWRHGMSYDELQKSYRYGLSKIYELVINTDPVIAYLLTVNGLADHKLVMAHVYGHADFFKHNAWYAGTNRKMLDEMANHASTIKRYTDRYGLETVEGFLDIALSLENLIDPYSVHVKRITTAPEPSRQARMDVKPHLERHIQREKEEEVLEDEIGKAEPIPARPERDVLAFLMQHAPLRDWQRDVLGMVREEAYYFAPQGMTKVMNEGWACVSGDTLVYTEAGLIPMADLVAGEAGRVFDGEREQLVYDQNVIPDFETITMKTRRGLELHASHNHRVLLADRRTWKRMDELAPGERIAVSGGGNLWPKEEIKLEWQVAERVSLEMVAAQAGVNLSTVLRFRDGRNVRRREAVARALEAYDSSENQARPQAINQRSSVKVPEVVTPEFGSFLGYLVGDGHISRVKRHFGLTTGDQPQALEFVRLCRALFDLEPVMKWDASSLNGRWRVLAHSETISDFLEGALSLTSGPSAREKTVPDAILRSPERVVRAFLRALFDCDGHAGVQGVILSSASETLSNQVQLMLLNYGILSRRRLQNDGCWHVHVAGSSAGRFLERVGFGLERKQRALESYIEGHSWFKDDDWSDEVISLERGRADVYDISVTDTHRYAAGGFVNHNSYWHSKMMTGHLMDDSEVIHYADVNSGVMGGERLNPYKLGLLLWRDLEERWDKGRHGAEYETCDDLKVKRAWDTHEPGRGRTRMFEVRRTHNDVMFIDEFLTQEFCEKHKLFVYELDGSEDQFEVVTREFGKIKQKLLSQFTNGGQPIIRVVDANFGNRGELYLEHAHDGEDLEIAKSKLTLENLFKVWSRPVSLRTVLEEEVRIMRFDGSQHQFLRENE